MTNEQCNALTKAIITGFNSLAYATATAGEIQGKDKGFSKEWFQAKPECCALPIEPPAPVEAETAEDDKWRDLEIGETIRPGDQVKWRDEGSEAWKYVHPKGTWVGRQVVENMFQFRCKIDAKDGEA
jgi:hypothetical protein